MIFYAGTLPTYVDGRSRAKDTHLCLDVQLEAIVYLGSGRSATRRYVAVFGTNKAHIGYAS